MSKISCRKCNGQHLTIKCSKNNNESKIQHNQTKHHKNNMTNSNISSVLKNLVKI